MAIFYSTLCSSTPTPRARLCASLSPSLRNRAKREIMRVAPKLVIFVGDADGFGPAVFGALHATPGCDLTREQSRFEISLEGYGVRDGGASGDLIHFLDHDGSPQASIILLPNFEPPVAACAVNETLASIMLDNSPELLTVIVLLFLPSPKMIQKTINPKSSESGVPVFGVGIGQVTESTQAMLVGISRPPPSLQINCETLACLLQMVQVLKMPTILIGTTIRRQSLRAKALDLEGLNELEEFLINHTGLCFSRDEICVKETEKLTAQESWRALYG